MSLLWPTVAEFPAVLPPHTVPLSLNDSRVLGKMVLRFLPVLLRVVVEMLNDKVLGEMAYTTNLKNLKTCSHGEETADFFFATHVAFCNPRLIITPILIPQASSLRCNC